MALRAFCRLRAGFGLSFGKRISQQPAGGKMCFLHYPAEVSPKRFRPRRGNEMRIVPQFSLIERNTGDNPNQVLSSAGQELLEQKGDHIQHIEMTLGAIGYVLAYRKLRSDSYGPPHARTRVFAVCLNVSMSGLARDAAQALVESVMDMAAPALLPCASHGLHLARQCMLRVCLCRAPA